MIRGNDEMVTTAPSATLRGEPSRGGRHGAFAALAALATAGSTWIAAEAQARGDVPVLLQITSNTAGDVIDPRLRSQDGERIVFVSDGDVLGPAPGHNEVYLYEIASGLTSRITTTPPGLGGSGGAARSTDDIFSDRPEFVAFISRGDFDPSIGNADQNPEIFLWELHSGKFHQLTDTLPPVENRDVYASDSGRCIAFSSNADLDNNPGTDPGNPGTGHSNADGSYEVFLYSVEGEPSGFPYTGNYTQLSNGPAGTVSSRPVSGGYIWARQCQTTAYVSDYDQIGFGVPGQHIYIYDRNSGRTDEMFAPKEIPWGIQPGNYSYPTISIASQFARGPFVVFQTDADLWRNGSQGTEMFRYRVFHPRMTQYSDQLVGNVERPVISDGGGLISFQSNGELLINSHEARMGGMPPFNADGNYEIFRMRGRRKIWQLTRSEGCDNTAPSTSDDGTKITFRSNCDLVPGRNPTNVPQAFLYMELKSDDPLTTAAGCLVSEGCCNEANGCYEPIFGRKPKTRPKDCIARPRDACREPAQ